MLISSTSSIGKAEMITKAQRHDLATLAAREFIASMRHPQTDPVLAGDYLNVNHRGEWWYGAPLTLAEYSQIDLELQVNPSSFGHSIMACKLSADLIENEDALRESLLDKSDRMERVTAMKFERVKGQDVALKTISTE